MRLAIILGVIGALCGCDKIGPLRDHNPENKVNSPSDPHYIPTPGQRIIDPSTGLPKSK